MNRGGNNAPQQNAPQPAAAGGVAPVATQKAGKGKGDKDNKLWRVVAVSLLFAVTVLLVALIAYMVFVKPNVNKQAEYVDTTKYQAVFLAGGQVYFGKIKALNTGYTKLDDIYYLRVNQQVQPNGTQTQGDVQLVKLGCELHGPQDSMVINSDQVIFWENLKDDGQVAQAVSKYQKENPDGQKCQTAQQNSGSDTNTNDTTNTNTETNTNTNDTTNTGN
jgi:hypothetical protein